MPYEDHAYERTIVAELQRFLLETFAKTEFPPKRALMCEEVATARSQVPQSAIMQVFQKLCIWEGTQRKEMDKYQFVKVDDDKKLAFLTDPGPVRGDAAEATSQEQHIEQKNATTEKTDDA